MKRAKPTIADVALRARVSVGTVSHVINRTSKVLAERHQRVMQAIDELGYEPNMLAKGLRRSKSGIIGLCMPHTSHSYLPTLVNLFEDITLDAGYELMQVFSHRDPDAELRRVKSLLRYNVDGIILFPAADGQASIKLIRDADVPLVVIDRPVEDRSLDQVTTNNRAAMNKAIRNMIGLGHRRFGFLVKSETSLVTRHRLEGIREAADEEGAAINLQILSCSDDSASFAKDAAAVLLSAARPTALLVSNSSIGASLLRLLEELGMRCPHDVSILFFEAPEWADLVRPRLSTVEQPSREIAVRSWNLLLRKIANPQASAKRIELNPTFHMTESVGTPTISGTSLPVTGVDL